MNYKLFTNLKAFQALLFLLIPVFLWIGEGRLLDSISAYAYYTPMLFGFLLTLAVAVFFYDGFVDPSRWYNMLTAIFLAGVVLFPHLDWPIIHYAAAVLFFLWSAANMVIFTSKRERWFKLLFAIFVIFGILGSIAFGWYSIFWAEWIGMLPISAHYVLEVLGKID